MLKDPAATGGRRHWQQPDIITMPGTQLLQGNARIASQRIGGIEFDRVIFTIHYRAERFAESILHLNRPRQAAFLASSARTRSSASRSSAVWSVMAAPCGVVR